jgi:hypothetical protein
VDPERRTGGPAVDETLRNLRIVALPAGAARPTASTVKPSIVVTGGTIHCDHNGLHCREVAPKKCWKIVEGHPPVEIECFASLDPVPVAPSAGQVAPAPGTGGGLVFEPPTCWKIVHGHPPQEVKCPNGNGGGDKFEDL